MPYKCTFCDKSFRYKVSQRTHKCAGIVAQATNEMNSHSDTVDILSTLIKPNKMALADYACDEDLTNQTLDELIAESCTKLGIGPAAAAVRVDSPAAVEQEQQNLPSPTAELENLCIYSPIHFPDLSDLSWNQKRKRKMNKTPFHWFRWLIIILF